MPLKPLTELISSLFTKRKPQPSTAPHPLTAPCGDSTVCFSRVPAHLREAVAEGERLRRRIGDLSEFCGGRDDERA